MKTGKQRVRGLAPSPVFSRKRAGGIVLGAMVVASAAVYIWSLTVPALTIRELSDNRVLYQIPVHPGSEFAVSYIHSIHRRPVEDHFHVNENRQIVLDATLFDSYGVGIPSSVENGETFQLEDGRMKLANMNRVLGSFDLRIGQVIANHQLLIKDRTIPLSRIGKPGSAVRFEVAKFNLWMYVKGALRNGG